MDVPTATAQLSGSYATNAPISYSRSPSGVIPTLDILENIWELRGDRSDLEYIDGRPSHRCYDFRTDNPIEYSYHQPFFSLVALNSPHLREFRYTCRRRVGNAALMNLKPFSLIALGVRRSQSSAANGAVLQNIGATWPQLEELKLDCTTVEASHLLRVWRYLPQLGHLHYVLPKIDSPGESLDTGNCVSQPAKIHSADLTSREGESVTKPITHHVRIPRRIARSRPPHSVLGAVPRLLLRIFVPTHHPVT